MIIAGLRLWIAGTNAGVVSAAGAGGECVLVDAPPDPGAILGHLEEIETDPRPRAVAAALDRRGGPSEP